MNRNFTPPPQRGSNTEKDQDEIDIGAIIATLWREKLVLVIFAGLFLSLGIYYLYSIATPTFRATAVVMLNNREEQVVDLESVIGGLSADASVVNTEVEVLRSRSLLGKVVDAENLLEDPEFNAELRDPGMVDQAKDAVKDFLGLEREAVFVDPSSQATRVREAVIDSLLSKLTVRNVSQSLVFNVTIETNTPQKSARISNTLVEQYILNQLEVKFEATEQATTWLAARVTELQTQLEAAEAEVKDFRANTTLINGESLEALERQLKELRDRILDTRTNGETTAARFAALSAVADADRTTQAQTTGDTQLTQLLPRVETASIAEAFDRRFQQLLTRAELEATRSGSQIAALEQSQTELEAQIAAQSADLITLQQLTREAEASRLLYEYFLSRLKETSAQQGIQQADSRVLSRAVIPVNPASPNTLLTLFGALVVGLLAGSAVVLLREMGNDTFRTGQMLENHTGYGVLGQVPMLPGRQWRDVIAYLAEKPTSAAAEAVRNLRTSVMLSNVDNPPKLLMTTSSVPGEGKTTLALALAQNLVGLGKKVLLIEGDIRRRVLVNYVYKSRPAHLIAAITGDMPLKDAVFADPKIDCDVIMAERTSVNAADLFSSDRFSKLLEEAQEIYDIVVIDTPPVLVVPDARIISQKVDATIFVVRWDKTPRVQVVEALKQFENVNTPVSGLVLNQISPKGMKRYGYGGQYGAYSAYGSKYYVN